MSADRKFLTSAGSVTADSVARAQAFLEGTLGLETHGRWDSRVIALAEQFDLAHGEGFSAGQIDMIDGGGP
jgi:hypothetical protein